MEKEVKLYEEGLEKYPMSRIVLGNVIMLLWLVLGAVAVWFFFGVFAWLYLFIAIILVYVVLRKLVCTNCYYYDKWCSMGWGKIAAFLFRRGKIEDFDESIGLRLAPVVYGLLALFPIIMVIVTLVLAFDTFTTAKIGTLVVVLFFSWYSSGISRRSACASCKMRTMCKGCAVKQ